MNILLVLWPTASMSLWHFSFSADPLDFSFRAYFFSKVSTFYCNLFDNIVYFSINHRCTEDGLFICALAWSQKFKTIHWYASHYTLTGSHTTGIWPGVINMLILQSTLQMACFCHSKLFHLTCLEKVMVLLIIVSWVLKH